MEIHFLRPYWFLLFVPSLMILLLLFRQLKNGNSWQKVIDPKLFQYLFNPSLTKANYNIVGIFSFVWFISILALAGPAWEKREQPVYRNSTAKIILLDLSKSMLAEDIKPNRLTRAKYKILDILRDYPEGQTGLAVFSSEAYTVSPLTTDTHTIALMVPDLSPAIMPVQGSDIGAGLRKAEMLFRQGKVTDGTIFLITDSNPNVTDDAVAKKIHSEGYNISVLAIGTPQGAPIPLSSGNFEQNRDKTILSKLNISALEKLAEIGGGQFNIFTNTNQDIKSLLASTLKQTKFNSEEKNSQTNYWYDEGRWFILLILPFVLLSFRRGWLEAL